MLNEFGKQQSDIDVKADEIIFRHLKESGVVAAAASEEKPYVSQIPQNSSPIAHFLSLMMSISVLNSSPFCTVQ
jgi:fructose-1,6-bisphosphatase